VTARPGKINSVKELTHELFMLVSRLNNDDIPDEFCRPVRETHARLNELARRQSVNRREDRFFDAELVSGDNRYPVRVRQLISHGFSVVSTEWIKEGEIIELRFPSTATETFSCAVIKCRRGSRPDDNGAQFFLLLTTLSGPLNGFQ
jgi:hypothetical protein